MPKATDVTVEVSTTQDGDRRPASSPLSSPSGDGAEGPSPSAGPSKPPRKKTKIKQKTTPLPFRQLVPMTFVLLNESLCGTMLMPFIGYLVAYLQGRNPDDAGYYSGLLQGIFSVGQIVSARFWGKMSDEYGRRTPLVSGLFTSGLMMLLFGLSGNLWLCGLFRFVQGAFNGNVLVAKTMMADITDKTNQAQGFAFVSFVSSIGLLIGPLVGGLLYDPTAPDSAMRFLGLDPDGIFATRPALLPSLFMFCYSVIGMTVCTLFVQESNPDAKPVPHVYKVVFPCLCVPAKRFEPTPMAEPEEVTDSEADCNDNNSTNADQWEGRKGERGEDGVGNAAHSDGELHEASSEASSADSFVDPRMEVSVTFPVGAIAFGSPVALEDTRRFDQLMEEHWMRQRSSGNYSADAASLRSTGGSTHSSTRRRLGAAATARPITPHGMGEVDNPLSLQAATEQEACAQINRFVGQLSASFHPGDSITSGKAAVPCQPVELSTRGTDDISLAMPDGKTGRRTESSREDAADSSAPSVPPREEHVTVAEEADPAAAEEGLEKPKSFTYREAFTRPMTRYLLIIYMIVCASDMTLKQCFPLWAISSVDKGGLGFTSSQVSYVLLFNSLPTLVSNYFFAIACRHYANKIGLFRVGVIAGLIFGLWLATNSYIPIPMLKYVLVVFCTASQQFFSTWCYGLITMLTARAAPAGQVGALLGINQSAGAASRAITPVITAPIYAWSIGGNHPWPFNHVFVFYLASLLYAYCWYCSYGIKTINDTELIMVTSDERFGPAWLRVIIVKMRGLCGA